MRHKFSKLLPEFRLPTPEMERSYIQLQSNIEEHLLTLYSIIYLPIVLLMVIIGLIDQLPLIVVLSRVASVAMSITAYMLRKRSRSAQKVLLLLIMVHVIFSLYYNRSRFELKSPLVEGFFGGNFVGILELILLLSYKDIRFRSFSYVVFLVAKLWIAGEELMTWNIYPMLLMMFFSFVVFYMYDNVQHRHTFKAIYESREELKKFQELLSNDLPSSIVILNSSVDTILYSNRFFQTQFREDDECLVPKQSASLDILNKFTVGQDSHGEKMLIEKDIAFIDFLKQFRDTIDTSPSQGISLLATLKNEDQAKIHNEIKVKKIVWNGEYAYAVVLHDLSDKQIVMALKLANKQKDRVIDSVSHELRTPINGTLGLLEMALNYTKDPVLLGYLENMKSCNKMLLYLVNSILDLNQIRNESLNLVKNSFALNTFLEEVRSLYSFSSQQKSIDFMIHTESNLPKTVHTDRSKLMEVLVSLLGNAFKFTVEGVVTLRVGTDPASNKLRFCIEDTGIGIKEKDKACLLRTFPRKSQNQSTKDSQVVGLGLTVANELVRALNEDSEENIEFDSEYGKGSKFWFKVDALGRPGCQIYLEGINMEVDEGKENLDSQRIREHDSPSPEKQITQYTKFTFVRKKSKPRSLSDDPSYFQKSPSARNKSSKHALIVDDNPFNLMAAAFILEQLGYTCQKAFNGKEGLELLEESMETGNRYRLVLTDIQMPVLDGIEMSKAIRQKIEKGELYDVPIVAVTAKSLTQQEIVKYRENGILSAFEKPLMLEELNSVLNKLGL